MANLVSMKIYDHHEQSAFIGTAIYTDDQEILEKEFLTKGVKIVKPLNVTDYKNKEFVIEDIDGRWIAFGLKIKD